VLFLTVLLIGALVVLHASLPAIAR